MIYIIKRHKATINKLHIDQDHILTSPLELVMVLNCNGGGSKNNKLKRVANHRYVYLPQKSKSTQERRYARSEAPPPD